MLKTALAFLFTINLLPDFGRAQDQSRTELSATYISPVDEKLTIRKITLMPTVDNVEGIYARPLETHLIQLIRNSPRFDYIDFSSAGTSKSAAELEENAPEVQKLLGPLPADAALGLQISRGPGGISIRLDLFLKSDGKLLLQEMSRDLANLDVNQSKQHVAELYRKLVRKLPYNGIILSRQQNRVTLNIGKADGISKDQILSVVQIINMQRHPKFNLLISTEKETLGRVKVTKVEDSLAFGAIISEKEKGVVRKGAKVSGTEPLNYPEPVSTDAASPEAPTGPDTKLAFGENPKEWIPQHSPQYGLFGFQAGLGNFGASQTLSSGAQETSSPYYPMLGLNGELWITQTWLVLAELNQAIIAVNNPRSGSSPAKLNFTLNDYSMSVGYNILMKNDFYGPRFRVRFGMVSLRFGVDDSTPSKAFTTTTFFGYILGISGLVPLYDNKSWYAGGELTLVLLPKMTETPVTSGSAGNITINDFRIFAEKSLNQNLRAFGELQFNLATASLNAGGNRVDGSGSPETASSISYRATNIVGGVKYLF